MTAFPPLRTGICTIGQLRFPAIIGKVEGETREIFVCGQHIDGFVSKLPERDLTDIRIDAAMFGREL